MTSRRRGVKYRGGLTTYRVAKNDIKAWMNDDQKRDARFTTMFDLYGLPTDFPDYEHAVNTHDPYDRVRILESALSRDISDSRLIPYFQLHEFEALLFCEPKILGSQFPDRGTEIRRLIETTSGFGSPELINDGSQTAPSKRIIKEIPEYEGRKASVGPIVANKIGLSILQSKCKHFGEWLSRLEALTQILQ